MNLRERWVIPAALATVAAGAWIYLWFLSGTMTMPSGSGMNHGMGSMGQVQPWTGGQFGLRLAMWIVMMVAMMLPSAVPMTLVYAAVVRKAATMNQSVAPTSSFVAGYLAVWVLFSVVATFTQLLLDKLALLSASMVVASPWLGAGLLVIAGIYELTPMKHACLEQCRGPAYFISRHWHSGTLGALRMGSEMGAYCVGCCWLLMALLFVGGVMNLIWIALIATFVLIEKIVPRGQYAGRAAGGAMILTGIGAVVGIVSVG